MHHLALGRVESIAFSSGKERKYNTQILKNPDFMRLTAFVSIITYGQNESADFVGAFILGKSGCAEFSTVS